jgi:hypothetical protein
MRCKTHRSRVISYVGAVVKGLRAIAVVSALLAVWAGSALAATPAFHAVDTRLCGFPLDVTVKSIGVVDAAAPAIGRFALTGPTAVTLRNGTTGRRATLVSSGSHTVDTRTGAVAFSGPQVWFWTTGKHVPFLRTLGAGRFSPDLVLSPGTTRARVLDPCALVGTRAAPKLRETPAPWSLPRHALSRIADAGLTPLLGRVIRHDHLHLDVIVNGRRVKVPGGIGLAEPLDGGPCPQGPGSSGDCATGESFFAQVANAPLHTHASSGLIHIESDRKDRYTLGQVFDEWGVRFDRRCVGGYCTGGGKQRRVYVNGRRVTGDPRAIVLAERQEIAVVFGSDFGSVPSRYAGRWPGPGCGGPGEKSCGAS